MTSRSSPFLLPGYKHLHTWTCSVNAFNFMQLLYVVSLHNAATETLVTCCCRMAVSIVLLLKFVLTNVHELDDSHPISCHSLWKT